jgi:hypothetical protein
MVWKSFANIFNSGGFTPIVFEKFKASKETIAF